MRILLFNCFMTLLVPGVMANSIFNFENNVSTGKIIIDGKEFGVSPGQFIKGSGKEKTILRNLSGYQRIKIGSGGFDVVYNAGKIYSLKITGDDNIVPWMQTEVKDGELQLSITKSYSSKLPITVSIASPQLEAISLEGSSAMRLNSIQAANFLIHSIGSGDISASGRVAFLKIHILGTGDVDVKNLISDKVNINVKGSGDLVLTAKQSLTTVVSGTGDIVYFGKPEEVNTKIFGVGEIESGD